MAIRLGPNRYGKSEVRLARVVREGAWHHYTDVTVDLRLIGDFTAAHVDGDNSEVLPTDTMRATVYALARQEPPGDIEDFGLRVAARLLDACPAAGVAEIMLTEHPWQRMQVGGSAHPSAFERAGSGARTATVRSNRQSSAVTAGIADLGVVRTAGSAFSGFLVDDYTVLAETDDRILATEITADWDYTGTGVDWGEAVQDVRRTLLEVFAEHDSESVQHTLYAMGEAVLRRRADIAEIRLRLPNQHHLLVDLSPYGMDNPGEVFVVADRPYGVIEATVVRD